MPHAPDLSGSALDERYELHAVIGEGAFGRVYRGWDRRLERTVAIKMIKPWWAEDPEWADSFEGEARLLARISHPGIVQIFDVGHAPEGLYYVSELVEGESLARRLARGPIDAEEAAGIAEQLCRALGEAHAERVIHRDVKPANILISTDGSVKVGDFGVARLAEGSTDGASATIVGTPRYMAPEQARGRQATPATDIYSVGVVLYEMFAGAPPFTERSAVELALRHLRDQPPPLPAGTPAALDQIVARALAKEPAERYANGEAMADALSRALGSIPGGRRPGLVRRRTRTSRRLHARARADALVTSGGASRLDDDAPTPRAGPRVLHDPPQRTRRAPKLTPRRNVNPAARRRSIAALTAAFLVLGAMIAGALVLGSTARVRVPGLLGMTRSRAQARAGRLALQTRFGYRYSAAPKGRVIDQRPRPRTRVAENSTVDVVLSAGPRPVPVPAVAGDQLATARAQLTSVGLRPRVTLIAAPGVPPGTVTSQDPAPRVRLAPPGTVALQVAEVPQWRVVTTLAGGAQPTSAQFRIRGTRWRVVYTMAYQGTCTWVFWCSGPQAQIDKTGSGQDSFGLNDGGRQTRTFYSGAGLYQLEISPGQDNANWRAWIEDYY
jgi:serine/threonine-protein kinase